MPGGSRAVSHPDLSGMRLPSFLSQIIDNRLRIADLKTKKPKGILMKKILKGILFILLTIFCTPIVAENCPAVHIGKISIKQFRVTAYCPCRKCCDKSDGLTATGYKVRHGDKIIAAAPEIPFGTKMEIPGYGTARVTDRGGKIKGNRLDVFFYEHKNALKWGIQFLEVKIYE